MEKNIKVNDLVWAKMMGFPPWPSLVVEPSFNVPEKPVTKDVQQEYFWIYFFGTHNYAWVEENHIKPYFDYKEKFTSLYKTVQFKEAVTEIENVLTERDNDPNYQVSLEPFKKKERNHTKRIRRPTSNTASKRLKLSSSIYSEENNSESELSTSSSHQSQIYNRELLTTGNITTSQLTFGILGIGIIGSEVVKNLIGSGHKVNIWNRTTRKCTELEAELGFNGVGYIKIYFSPRAVMEHSDIVFNCVSDHDVSKRIIQSYFGINNSTDNILNGKGFVEMTGIDPETSKDIRDMIEKKGGRYLEAQVQGSKIEAAEGRLVILTAGNKFLFLDCQSCFKAMGKTAFFLGDVGYATKINLIIQLIKGVCLAGLAEGLALAERCGISLEQFLDVFNLTNLAGSYLTEKANNMKDNTFSNVEQSLQNLQKDMKLGLELSSRVVQPMELASAANEIMKHCRRFDYSNQDSSSIYMRTKF